MRPKSTTPGVIFLTRGLVAIVDVEDFEALNAHVWQALPSHDRTFYATRWARVDGSPTTVFMHRVLMGAKVGEQVDHRDGDGLNNSRSNLRIATHAQNQRNRGPLRTNTSGYKGVYFDSWSGRWRAIINAEGRVIRLGYFTSPEDAARAYDAAATRLHGEFARLNFGSLLHVMPPISPK